MTDVSRMAHRRHVRWELGNLLGRTSRDVTLLQRQAPRPIYKARGLPPSAHHFVLFSSLLMILSITHRGGRRATPTMEQHAKKILVSMASSWSCFLSYSNPAANLRCSMKCEAQVLAIFLVLLIAVPVWACTRPQSTASPREIPPGDVDALQGNLGSFTAERA